MRIKNQLLTTAILLFSHLFASTATAQSFAINNDASTAHPSAMLDVKSTTKGLLAPRMDKAARQGIAAPATGLLVYQTAPDSTGFYYYNGAAWEYMSSSALAWSLTGNAGVSNNNFIGTTDAASLHFRVNNLPAGSLYPSGNTAFGLNALLSGSGNNITAIGANTLSANGAGADNTAAGTNALAVNINGDNNTALGSAALQLNTGGDGNTAAGYGTLAANTGGSGNTALGLGALLNNNGGNGNTALGAYSGQANVSGEYNVFTGFEAGFNNDTSYNVFTGYRAGYAATKGFKNTFTGNEAGRNTSTGSSNTAFGNAALRSNTTGTGSVAVGDSALHNSTGSSNTAVGNKSLLRNTGGTQNVAAGHQALLSNTGGSDNVAIGAQALQNNTAAGRNIAIGTQALQNSTNSGFPYNVAIGYRALARTTGGNQNVIVGSLSAEAALNISNNVFVGFSSGSTLQFGGGNTFLGHGAGSSPINGDNNTAIGYASSITSGNVNSTAIGFAADVIQSNSMVFGNDEVTKWGFGTNPAAGSILEFPPLLTTARLSIGGVWINASDRHVKTNFSVPDGQEMLDKIMQLPVTRWSYQKEGNKITHIGPMAQDFFNLFQTGEDDKTISTIDPSGVALLGVQQLKRENNDLRTELAEQRQLIVLLQEQVRKLMAGK